MLVRYAELNRGGAFPIPSTQSPRNRSTIGKWNSAQCFRGSRAISGSGSDSITRTIRSRNEIDETVHAFITYEYRF